MKTQSNIFALLLVGFIAISINSQAQTNSLPSNNEPKASQDVSWLIEEIQLHEPVISNAQKNEKRSSDAMQWNAVYENQKSPLTSTGGSKQVINVNRQAASPSIISVIAPVDKGGKGSEKTTNHSL